MMVYGKYPKGAQWKIMKEILDKSWETDKYLTPKEFKEQCLKRGISQSTFYYNFKKQRGKYFRLHVQNKGKPQIIVPVGKPDKATVEEIDILFDGIKFGRAELKKMAAKNFWQLCKSKDVTHYPKLDSFFGIILSNREKFSPIYYEILLALKHVIKRYISQGNTKAVKELLWEGSNKNIKKTELYKIIEEFAKSKVYKENDTGRKIVDRDAIHVKIEAIKILSIISDPVVLQIIYQIIRDENIERPEYGQLEATIKKIFLSYNDVMRFTIKKELVGIVSRIKSDILLERVERLLSVL